MSLSWGVRAFFYDEEESLDDIIFDQINILKERGFIKTGNVVVNTGSTPYSPAPAHQRSEDHESRLKQITLYVNKKGPPTVRWGAFSIM